jgi:hypothetical protein
LARPGLFNLMVNRRAFLSTDRAITGTFIAIGLTTNNHNLNIHNKIPSFVPFHSMWLLNIYAVLANVNGLMTL